MKTFPMMRPLAGQKCLLVGGGTVALRKAEKLSSFGAAIYVCARECADFSLLGARVLRCDYHPRLLEGMDIAVAATDDRAINARVAQDCRARGIPVNSVDDVQNCDFFFPALVVRGDVVVGISTGGASPALAAVVREYLENCLPVGLEEVALRAKELRGTLPAEEYKKRVRELFYAALGQEGGHGKD